MSANRRRGRSRLNSVSDAAWASYLWFNANPKGEAREIWLHLTCMAMFAMRRDTAANTVMGSDALGTGDLTGARLPIGGDIDRGRPYAFTFNGTPNIGFAGDSIASALLANDVRVVDRSFKYHRPRGIWGAWTEEPNAIVDVARDGKTTPNLRATTEALENDLAVRSVNAAPTAAADRVALIDQLAPVLPAGFITRPSSGRAGKPSKARSAP